MPHNLSYPLNVEGDDQQGHYIMFMINEVTPGKLITNQSSDGKSIFGTTPKTKSVENDTSLTGFQEKIFIDRNINAGAGKSTLSTAPSAGGLAMRPGTTRMSEAITLYMPPSVKVSYKSNYKNDEIGALAETIATTGASIIDGLTSEQGLYGTVKKAGTVALAGAAAFAADKAVRMANTAAPGAQTLAQISAGAILGSKMEVMFTDVGRRNFSFSFNFIPKSEEEARMVYKIVQTFKEHMLPEYLSGINIHQKMDVPFAAGRLLKIPDTFDIFYFFHNNENPFLNRISTCYLTSLDIDYGGDKYVTYEPIKLDGQVGPPPQRTNITLAFTEIETITRERAKQGF